MDDLGRGWTYIRYLWPCINSARAFPLTKYSNGRNPSANVELKRNDFLRGQALMHASIRARKPGFRLQASGCTVRDSPEEGFRVCLGFGWCYVLVLSNKFVGRVVWIRVLSRFLFGCCTSPLAVDLPCKGYAVLRCCCWDLLVAELGV